MAELTPDIAAVVKTACEQNAEQVAGAFSRTFDLTLEASVGSAETCQHADLPASLDGPGLLVMLKFGEIAAIGVLPEVSGLQPQWYAEPDLTGQSKLTTLAQELSMLLVPEEFMAEEYQAAKVANLKLALMLADMSPGAGLVPLNLTSGEQTGTFYFVWPCYHPLGAYQATEPQEAPLESLLPTPEPTPPTVVNLEELPPYTRSLLRIKVPVMVSLASKKQSIHEIIELGAGSIIKFEKSCEEMLDLEVGGHPIAQGEAVKVGDKFGLRINSMILPGERFKQLSPHRK